MAGLRTITSLSRLSEKTNSLLVKSVAYLGASSFVFVVLLLLSNQSAAGKLGEDDENNLLQDLAGRLRLRRVMTDDPKCSIAVVGDDDENIRKRCVCVGFAMGVDGWVMDTRDCHTVRELSL